MSAKLSPTRLLAAGLVSILGFVTSSLLALALAEENLDNLPPVGLPGRRVGGGTRLLDLPNRRSPDILPTIEQGDDDCLLEEDSLVALLPKTNLGFTTTEYPRFFWYMPKTTASSAEFSLHEVGENRANLSLIYRTTFKITGETGIVSLTLPSDVTIPKLLVNKDYRWSVSIICNPDYRQNDVEVNGWVRRIPPTADLKGLLELTNSSERARVYAEQGIWFDRLNALAQSRCANPGDFTLNARWAALMRSVGLEAIANEPLVECSE